MKARRIFERKLRASTQLSNFHIALGAKSFILIMGILVITNSRYGGTLGFAIFLIAYEVLAAWVAQSRFALGVLMVVILNFLILTMLFLEGLIGGWPNDPLFWLWLGCTGCIVIAGIIILVAAAVLDTRRVTEY